MKFYSKEEESDFSEFNLMQLSELSKKLKESQNLNEFYKKNPGVVQIIQTIKELAKKPEKYIKIRSSLISNILRLKKAWDFSSYTELNDFLSKLADHPILKSSEHKTNEIVNPTPDNLIQKSE